MKCPINLGDGKVCGRPPFANSSAYCETHFAQKFPATYGRLKAQEEINREEAAKYEAERDKNRRPFDP